MPLDPSHFFCTRECYLISDDIEVIADDVKRNSSIKKQICVFSYVLHGQSCLILHPRCMLQPDGVIPITNTLSEKGEWSFCFHLGRY